MAILRDLLVGIKGFYPQFGSDNLQNPLLFVMKHSRFILALLLLICSTTVRAFVVDGLHFRIINENKKTVEVTYMAKSESNYYQFTDIEIPDYVMYNLSTYTVRAIGDSAFRLAQTVKTVSIPETVTRIGKQAFYGSGLTELELPESVETLDEGTFGWCVDLKSCKLNTKIKDLPSGVFAGTYGLFNISLPPQIKVIGKWAFQLSGLESIELSDSLELIDDYAFQESWLWKVKIPDKVHTIGYQAFDYVPLDSVWFGKSLRTIKSMAFWECYNLSYINLPQGLQYIGEGAFECADFSSLDLVIPGSTQEIGVCAFSLTGLRSVVFENGVDRIKEGALC